ncbi:alkaline phosphatase family protein [Acidicapsa dinghuensis]|uniref:Alkaline phosphatase family protein n=1 Tax=Acidicapsa dinghuensis TaxID=2218256 RepID=A0ABW1EID7_9BACT|nr:alkaline phosphatase family protein [Acidicapsa dinghuensis]
MKFKSLAVFSLAAIAAVGYSQESNKDWDHTPIRHVLLISVDGMHAVDLLNCANGVPGVNGGDPYCPNLAALTTTGVNYTAASTSRPSDSFPGLMSIVTGATPRTMGVYYDVSYDRSLDAPAKTTGNGVAAGPCTAGAAPTGTRTEYEEGIDKNQGLVNGGAPGAGPTDGGIASIDPQRLIRDPKRGCAPVWPWEFVRTNTIFGVIHQEGGYTAWSDKHPAYSAVAGRNPDGAGALNDYYSPEINSNVVGLPGVKTPTGIDCSVVPDSGSDLTAWTNSFQNIQCYDQLKVNAILNEIEGKTHDGKNAKVPTIFGMNFQAVSVGQKLVEKSNGTTGGYQNAAATPTPALLTEFQFIDDSIGAMVNKIKDRGLYESTLIIITAKHGQNPIDPAFYVPILNSGTSPATILSNANLLPFSESTNNATGIGPTEDDISLLWLNSSSETKTAVSLLETNKDQAGIGQIFYGPSLSLNYNTPGLGAGLDPRTPDIIVTPNVGVVYTGSTKKESEHGGFAHDDTNVILLVSNPGIVPHTVYSNVGTNQVAPTILKSLGIDPKRLDGVRWEGTATLPQ